MSGSALVALTMVLLAVGVCAGVAFRSLGTFSPLGEAAYVPTLAFLLFVGSSGGVLVRHPEAGEVRMPTMARPTTT